jgi:cytoskeletal protein RodZ
MSETIGQQLRQAREARALTLEQVSRATHIRPHYLQALEAGAFNTLPSKAQARGFLRAYAGFLGLDADDMLAEMEKLPAEPVQGNPGGAPAAPPAVSTNGSEYSPEIQAFFVDVGQKLRQQRELLGLSIEDVERQTRLRTFYLRALEAGELDRLPSPVQGRGMLKNYAAFLGLDPEPLLLRFADGLQARLLSKQQNSQPAARPVEPRQAAPREEERARGANAYSNSAAGSAPIRSPSILRRLFSGETLLFGVVVVSLVGFMIWGAVRIFAMREDQNPAATSRSISEVLLDPGTPSPTPVPVTPTVEDVLEFTPTGANQIVEEPAEVTEATGEGEAVEGTPGVGQPAGGGGSGVQVYLTIRQRTWLRVLVDGEVQQDGRVPPDSAFQFSGEEQVEVFTANGAAVEVFYNGQNRGLLGNFGEVVYEIYSQDGVLTPTPTITLTPTTTVRPSPTPRGTPAPPTPGAPTG